MYYQEHDEFYLLLLVLLQIVRYDLQNQDKPCTESSVMTLSSYITQAQLLDDAKFETVTTTYAFNNLMEESKVCSSLKTF